MNQIVLCGVGGQGILLASRVLAYAAAQSGLEVRTAETIGMAQRGGSVVTHIRIATKDEMLLSPMVPTGQADVIVAFEPGEVLRSLSLLGYGKNVASSTQGICPSGSSSKEVEYSVESIIEDLKRLAESGRIGSLNLIDPTAICDKCGSAKVLNTVMLGAAAGSGMLGFSPEQIRDALKYCIKPNYLDMNLEAFDLACSS